MISKKLFEKPLIAIGLLMAFILAHQLYKKGYFSKRSQLLKATSCYALNIKLERRIPKDWVTLCENNNLTISTKSKLFKQKLADPAKVNAFVYGELANKLMFVAKNSPGDNLERTFLIKLILETPDKVISAITEGKHLVKLQTLTDKGIIANHLKSTVQIVEKISEKEKK